MKRLSSLIPMLIVAAAFVGCARSVTSYVFSPPTFNQQAWTLAYPKERDTQPVKCILTNDQTGAVITVMLDPSSAPTARYSTMSMQDRMRSAGYNVGALVRYEDSRGEYAGFVFSYGHERGKVVAVRRPNVDKTFLLLGVWDESNDVIASIDIDRLAREFDVTAYEVPPG